MASSFIWNLSPSVVGIGLVAVGSGAWVALALVLRSEMKAAFFGFSPEASFCVVRM